MRHSKLIPPFKVFVCHQDGSQETLAEGANFPDALQLRLAWTRKLEGKGYKLIFGSFRMTKEGTWEECLVTDSNGKRI